MTHHENQFRARHGAPVLHAPDQVFVSDVAGDAEVEKIAEALIKDKFRRGPGIHAAEDNGVRILAGSDDLLIMEPVARGGFSGEKAGISLPERFQNLQWHQRQLFSPERGQVAARERRWGGGGATGQAEKQEQSHGGENWGGEFHNRAILGDAAAGFKALIRL
jgi:hypothetical protein